MNSPRFFFLCLAAFAVSVLSAQAVEVRMPGVSKTAEDTLIVALKLGDGIGSTIVELEDDRRVFLAFQADTIAVFKNGEAIDHRSYRDFKWQSQDLEALSLELEAKYPIAKLDIPDATLSAAQWFVVNGDGVGVGGGVGVGVGVGCGCGWCGWCGRGVCWACRGAFSVIRWLLRVRRWLSSRLVCGTVPLCPCVQ